MASKTAFLTLSIDTKQAVSTFDELKKTAKELQAQLSKLRPDDAGFEALKEKVVLAKKEIYSFQDSLRVTPSFVDRLSNSIKIGMQDVAIRAGKAETAIHNLKTEQEKLVKEISLTTDAVKKGDLVAEFKKVEDQIKRNQNELHKFNQELNKGFAENKDVVQGFSVQTNKNFKETNDVITNSVSNIKQSFQGIGAGLVGLFAVDKLIEFGKESAKFYEEVQRNESRLGIALQGRKDIQDRLIEQAKDLEVKSGIDDQEIIKQQTFLAQQGRTQEQIEKTIKASIALAKVTGDDLSTAVGKLDSTFEGTTGKLGKLDSGINTLTQSQLENGGAVDIILDKYGNQIDIQTDAERASNNLGVALEDLKEKLGGIISQGGGINQFLADMVNGFSALIDITAKYSSPFAVIAAEAEEAAERVKAAVEGNNSLAEKEFDSMVKRLVAGGKSTSDAIEQVYKSSTNSLNLATQSAIERNDEKQKFLYQQEQKHIDEIYKLRLASSVEKQKQENVKLLQDKISHLNKESSLLEENSQRKIQIEKNIITQTAILNATKAKNDFSQNPERLKEELDKIEEIRITSLNNLYKKENDITNQLTQKNYQDKLKIIQTETQNEILSTESNTVARLEAERKGIEKEKEFKLSSLRSVIASENELKVGTVAFEEEYQRRKENIILTSSDKEIQIEKNKQALLKSLFQQGQADRLAVFPPGTIENIEEQIRQAQDRLRLSLAQSNTGLSITPSFNPADLVKYSTEIKKLYSDLAKYQADLRRSELQAEQSKIQTQLLGVEKGSEEELQLKRELIENKKQLDLLEVNSKLAAYDLIKQANISLTEQELAEYKRLTAEKERINAESNANVNKANQDSRNADLQQVSTYANAIGSAFLQIYDTIQNAERAKTDNQIQNIERGLQTQLASLDKQEEQELKTSTNKEATQAKFRRKKEQAEKEAHKQEAALKKKQFEADKKAAIIKAVIGGALAVLNGLNTQPLFPLGIIMAALAAVLAGVQINAISNQPTPEFKRGGILNMYPNLADGGNFQGILKGSSHSDGGINLVDGKTGEIKGQVEGTETVLTGAVSKSPELLQAASDINVKAGGKPFLEYGGILNMKSFTPPKLEQGGVIGSTSVRVDNTVDFTQMENFFNKKLSQPMKAFVIGTEITDQQNLDSIIEKRSKLVA